MFPKHNIFEAQKSSFPNENVPGEKLFTVHIQIWNISKNI